MESLASWDKYYKSEKKNIKPLVPESFIARCFLSQRPIALLPSYEFENLTVLDVGCGDGRHVDFFQMLGLNVAGVEVTSSKVIELKQKFIAANFEVGTSSQLPFKEQLFDFLVAVNSIYYLNSQDTLVGNISSCASKLKSKGIFIASFIGHKHFILPERKPSKMNVLIQSKYHQCQDDVTLAVIQSKAHLLEVIESSQQLKVENIGEIQDELQEKNRHLYYVVASRL